MGDDLEDPTAARRSSVTMQAELDVGPSKDHRFLCHAAAINKRSKTHALQVLTDVSVAVTLEFRGWELETAGGWDDARADVLRKTVAKVLADGSYNKHGKPKPKRAVVHATEEHISLEARRGPNAVHVTVVVKVPDEYYDPASPLLAKPGCCSSKYEEGDLDELLPQRIANLVDLQTDHVIACFRSADCAHFTTQLKAAYEEAKIAFEVPNEPTVLSVDMRKGEVKLDAAGANQIILWHILDTPFGWHMLTADAFHSFFFKVAMASMLGVVVAAFSAVVASILEKDAMKKSAMGGAIICMAVVTGSAVAIAASSMCLRKQKDKREMLHEYGVGTVLYFKAIKFFIALFGSMALLALPALFCFVSGTSFKNDELKSVELLTLTTLGSLGEQRDVCQDTGPWTAPPTQPTLLLGCPSADYRMTTVTARVGKPTGYCGCEPALKPDSGGSCPATIGLDPATGALKTFATYLGVEPVLQQPCCGIGNPPAFTSEPSYPPAVGNALVNHPACSVNTTFAAEIDALVNARCNDLTACTLDAAFLDTVRAKFRTAAPSCAGNRVIVQAKCYADRVYFGKSRWFSVDKDDVAWVVTGMDILGSFIFFFMVFWLASKEKAEAAEIDAHIITTDDFSLRLVNVPKMPAASKAEHAAEHVAADKMTPEQIEKLTKHFTDNLDELDTHLRNHIENVINGGPKADKKLTVVEINYGLNTASVLSLQRKWVNLQENLEEVLNNATKAKGHKDGAELPKAMQKKKNKIDIAIAGAVYRIQMLFAKTHKLAPKTAFVTFEQSAAVAKCRNKFKSSSWCPCLVKDDVKFRSPDGVVTTLHFEDAPTPTSVIWDNAHYSDCSKRLRSLFAWAVVGVCLIISGAIIWQVKVYKAKLDREFPPVVCASSINYDAAIVEKAMYGENCALNATTGGMSCGSCDTVGEVECYCKSFGLDLTKLLAVPFFGKRADITAAETATYAPLVAQCASLNVKQESLCEEWGIAAAKKFALMIGSVAAVVIVNALLDMVMFSLSRFEKHFSDSTRQSSTALKIFMAQLMNTCFVMLMVNMNLELFVHGGFLFSGSFSDMSVSWYRQVGATLLLTMIINCFAPHVSLIIKLGVAKLKLWNDRRIGCCTTAQWHSKQMTQDNYEQLFMGPSAYLERRYGQMLNSIFMTMIFSAPMPALLWIAALNFTTLFWVDKICFLRLYRSDTLPSDDSLARLLRFFLPLALLWHFLFATWAFSNPSILRGTGTGFANSLTIVGKANEQRSTLSNVLDVVFTSRLSNCPVSTIFFFLSAIAVVGFMIVKAYFLDKLLGCFAACKDFLSRKGEDNPDFHKVLTTVRLHSIVDGEDGQPSVFPERRRKLAEAELLLREADPHRFNPENQLGLQALHSYSVAANPKYDGVTLDLAELARRIEDYEAEHPDFMSLAHKDGSVKLEKLAKKFKKKKKAKKVQAATTTPIAGGAPVAASGLGSALATVEGAEAEA